MFLEHVETWLPSSDNLFFLFLGMAIGYVAGCIRRTMIYARKVKHEVHEIHVELQRLEGKIDGHHPPGESK